MKRIVLSFMLPVMAGCLSPATVETIDRWTVVVSPSQVPVAQSPKYGAVRLTQIGVRSPYTSDSLAVLRPNGSIAFDPYNAFAAIPAQVLRGPMTDAIAASGLFAAVVEQNSSALSDCTLEITVRRLALDCREGSGANASVALSMVLLRGRGQVVASAEAEASEPAPVEGGYSAPFSTALERALSAALRQL